MFINPSSHLVRMSIDDKLGPISRRLGPIGRAYWHIDEEVHRYYERIVKRWEEDGHERKTLVVTCAYAALGSCLLIGPTMPEHLAATALQPLAVYGGVTTSYLARKGRSGAGHDGIELLGNRKITTSSYDRAVWGILRSSRLPELATGCGALITGGIQILRGIQDRDMSTIHAGAFLTTIGVFGITHASAIYFIDKEPSLLDKAPAWKRALDSVKEYFAPTPAPVPIPVQNYLTTEVNP